MIPGLPGVARASLLSDKRHVAAQDVSGRAVLWDLPRGLVAADFGVMSQAEFGKKVAEMDEPVRGGPAWRSFRALLCGASVRVAFLSRVFFFSGAGKGEVRPP